MCPARSSRFSVLTFRDGQRPPNTLKRELRAARFLWGIAVLLALWAADPAPAQSTPPKPAAPGPVPASAPYKDTSLPFEKRVADLISRMTLREKADQVQYSVPTNSRLGIPAVNWWTEALHGVSRAGQATVFPQAIAMAAAWDPPLLQKVGDATADEARAKFNPNGVRYYGLMIWAPTINMARDPRWGRTEETYGEDPFLTGRLAVSMVKGLQGDDPKYLKTVATPKHFAMHSQETGRLSSSFDCPEAVLRDYYFPAFRDAFVEGKAASTMAAFNGINKIPVTANFWLLTDVLRREWGFEGAVVTDWGGVSNLLGAHRYVATDEQAVATALNAGVDVISDPRENWGAFIVSAIDQKILKVDVLERALARNLLLRFRLGMFDPPSMVPFVKPSAPDVIGSPAHVALALKMAQESLVLLKNDPGPKGFGFDKSLLPLDLRRIDSIAVLGPYANTIQLGAYSGMPRGPTPTILTALRAASGDRVTIRNEASNDSEANAKAARASDVVIFVCGLNGNIDKEGADRPSLLLPSEQQNLLERVVQANPLTIVLLEGGNSIGLAWMKEHVPAIMMLWYPGEQGGPAVAQTLLGKINPSGHLPLTFYRANDDLPPLNDYDITKGRTYQYLQKPVPYVFGHGLSYTAFDYGPLHVTPTTATADGTLTVTVNVTNSGPMDGDEVVQVYVHEKPPAVTTGPASTTVAIVLPKRPIKQLKAFQRLTIPKGQTLPVTFSIPVQNLAFWDTAAKKYLPEPGVYEIMVGRSSEGIRGKVEITIK